MKATLSNYRQSPRKVRLVANALRGKTIARALATLQFMEKRAAEPLRKLLASAAANARQTEADASDETLVVKEVRVDKGLTLKRYRPASRGRAAPIKKRMSRVTLVLEKQQ